MTSGGLIDDTGKTKTEKTEADKHTKKIHEHSLYRDRRREKTHPSTTQVDEYSPAAVPTYVHT